MAEGGLEVPIGVSLGRLQRQLLQAEQRFDRAARKMEGRSRTSTRLIRRSYEQVGRSANAVASGGLRNVGLQLNQVTQQMAAGTGAARALSIQLPDLLLGFGTFGALAGVAAGALAPMIVNLLGASDATDKLVESLIGGEASLSNVRSMVSELRDIQEQYTEAIRASADASNSTAAAVAANSAKEFEARRQVLQIELELLRVRAATLQADRASLQTSVQQAGDDARGSTSQAIGAPGVSTGVPGGRPSDFVGVNVRPRGIEDIPGLDGFTERVREERLALEKLSAEAKLTDIAIDEAERALSGEFRDVGAGGASPESGGGRSGGGGGGSTSERAKRLNKLTQEGAKLTEQLRSEAERYAAQQGRLNDLLRVGAIDQQTYQRAMADLEQRFGNLGNITDQIGQKVAGTFDQVFDAILDGSDNAADALRALGKELIKLGTYQALAAIFPGTFGASGTVPLVANADGNAFSRGRIKPFARGGVVNRPTLFPMADGAGLMGEAGPEAVMPLKRIGGKLGVSAEGAGGVTINVNNYNGSDVQVERRPGRIEIEVRDAVARVLASGGADRAMRQRFGLGPRARGA